MNSTSTGIDLRQVGQYKPTRTFFFFLRSSLQGLVLCGGAGRHGQLVPGPFVVPLDSSKQVSSYYINIAITRYN
jgi:hypothetical protein